MPYERNLKYKNSLNSSAEALETLESEDAHRKGFLSGEIVSCIDNARTANARYEHPLFYINRAQNSVNDLMHELAQDYVIGVIPKEYFMGMIHKLNILKVMIKNYNYNDENAQFGYGDWEKNLPNLFVKNEEGDYEKQKTIAIRREGGLRVHLNTLTDEMLAMLPEGTQDAYKQGFIVEDKDKIKDNDNNVIDTDFRSTYMGDYDYRYPLKIDYRKMTEQEIDALENKTDLTGTRGQIETFVDGFIDDFNQSFFKNEQEKKEFDSVLTNIHFSPEAKEETMCLYMLWAMAEKDMSFEDASKVMEGADPSQEDIDAFKSFCKDNQILKQNDSPAKFKEKIEKWSEFMVKAMDKIKAFQIPDIDYNDKKAVAEKYQEFFLLAKMGSVICENLISKTILLDTSKEFSARSVAVDAMGGEKQFMKNIGFWRNIQGLTKKFNDAFYREDIKQLLDDADDPKETLKDEVRQSQAGFYYFGKVMNENKGKTLGEAADKVSFDFKIREAAHENVIYTQLDTIPDDDVFDYAEGLNSQPFTDKMEAFYQEQKDKEIRTVSNELINKSYGLVQKAFHKKEKAAAILSSPNSAEGTIEFLKQKDANGKCYSEYIKDFFGRYNSDLSMTSLVSLNMNISELFVIEGKSAKELWGDKYKNVQNPEEKELLYRTEIYKAMLRQETDIKVKSFELENGKLKQTGVVTVLPRKAKVESILNSFEMYKEAADQILNKSLRDYYALLETNKEDNAEYQKMHDSLKKVVEGLGNLGKKSEVKLSEALNNLQQFKTDFITYRTKVEHDEDPFRLNLDNDSTPEEEDLQDAINVMSECVKNMSSDIMTGDNKNISLNEPVPKYLNYLKNNYDNFTCEYHKSKASKTKEEIQLEIRDLKDEIKNRQKFPEVKAKVINKQTLTMEDLIVFNSNVRYFTTYARISEVRRGYWQKLVPPEGNPNRQKYYDIFRRVPFAASRGDTMSGVFVLWNMGHKGMSFRDALDLLKSDKAQASIDEFVSFCEENFVRDNPDPKKGKEAAIKWAKIMQNATDRMKEYSIGDIDLNDPKSIEGYLDEIDMVRTLSINFTQEFSKRVCSSNIPAGVDAENNVYGVKIGEEYIADTLGGKDNLVRIQQYWKNLQAPFGLLTNAYADFDEITLNEWQNGNIQNIIPEIVRFAANEVYGKYVLNKCKDIHNISPVDFYKDADCFTRITQLSGDVKTGTLDVKPEVVLDYVTGANKKPFEDLIIAELEKRTAKTFEMDMWGSAGNELISEIVKIKTQDAQTLLAATEAQDILNFVEAVSEDRNTNYKLINHCFNDFFSSERVMMADSLKLSVFDLIKVGDKTANELWGEKYNHLDANKKQSCICAEILRSILKGDKEVTHQSFKVENGEIKLGETYLVMPTRQDAKNMHDSMLIFDGLRQQITMKLMEYSASLKSTHPANDPNANMESHTRVGSQPYQDMCLELARCLYILNPSQSRSFSIPKFRNALHNFQVAAEKYSKRGKTSNPVRMEVADSAAVQVNGYVGMLDNIIKICDKNYFTSEGKYIDCKPSTISTMALNRRNVVQRADTTDITMPADRQKIVIDFNLARSEYKYKLKRMVGALPDISNTTRKVSTSDMAKLYVLEQYNDAVNKLDATELNTDYIKDKGDSFDKSVFDQMVDSVKDNKVFQLVVKKYQGKAVRKWNDVVKKANEIIDVHDMHLNSSNASQHAEYVLTPKINLTGKKDYKINSKYDRLGEIVARQIIVHANNENGTIAQAMAAGFIDYKDVVKACSRSLENDRVLDKADMNADKLANQIRDKEYMNTVMYKIAGSFRKSVEQKAKQPVNEQQAVQNAPHI